MSGMSPQHPAAPETRYPTGALVPERQRCICGGVCLDHCRACNYSGRDLEEPCIADPDWEPDDDDLARREGLPAAPETETDANGLTEAEVAALRRCCWPLQLPTDMRLLVERIVAERVRVVEGERDAARHGEAYWKRIAESHGPCSCDTNPETTGGPEEDCPQHGRRVGEWIERGDIWQARAESAEAAHEAEKAAHERLRAGVWALGESIHGDEGVEHVEGCEGEPTCFACILDTLRSLLGGGEAR